MLSVQLSMNNTWVSFISRIRITLYQFYNYSTSRQIFFYKSITPMTQKNQPYLFESELFNLASTIQWKKNQNYSRFSLFNIIEESKLFKLPTAWYQLCKSINPLFSFSFLCEDKYYWSFFYFLKSQTPNIKNYWRLFVVSVFVRIRKLSSNNYYVVLVHYSSITV